MSCSICEQDGHNVRTCRFESAAHAKQSLRNSEFWAGVEATAKVVDTWPEWKKRGSALADNKEPNS